MPGSALGSFGPSLSTSPTVAAGLSSPISPGEVEGVQIDNKDMTESGRYYLNYQDVPMDIQGCAGYAQARQFAVVCANFHKVTLYGQSFSIG